MVPVDTSECERVFSLMNDTNTAERSNLGQFQLNIEYLSNLLMAYGVALHR